MDVPYDIVLPRNSRLARESRVRPADLADDDWLLPDFGPDSPSLKLIGRMCAAAGFEPRVALRVNDCHMSQALVAAGEGVSILPRLLLDPVHPGVAVRPVAGEAPTMRVAGVRVPTRYLAPATAAFLVVLKEAAKRRVDSWTSRPGDQAKASPRRSRDTPASA